MISTSRHQLAGPLDDADADEQQRAAQASAEGEVRGADAARTCRRSSPTSESEVRDHEEHRADRRTAAKSAATWRSARFSAFGSTSVGRQWCSGQPRVGESSRAVHLDAWRLSWALTLPPSSCSSCGWCGPRSRRRSRRGPDADQPGGHALGDGAEAAEGEAAVRGLLTQGVEVGDDVALLLGRRGCRSEARPSGRGPVSRAS